MNKICVEIEIALKSKVRRRRINDASQTSRLINDAHEADVT